jgi:hypothetical protein
LEEGKQKNSSHVFSFAIEEIKRELKEVRKMWKSLKMESESAEEDEEAQVGYRGIRFIYH